MKAVFAILAAAVLFACSNPNGGPIVENLPAASGSAVPIGKAVQVGDFAVEPLRVVSDSRCPSDVTCVWAGTLVLETAIATDGWSGSAELTLGQPAIVHGTEFTLVEATPYPATGNPIEPGDYRFRFTGGTE